MVTVIRVTPAEAAALAAAKSPTKYNGNNNNENGGGKKRSLPSPSGGKENSKRQRTADKFALDLEGVPPQQPIPKSNWFFDDGRIKVRASKASKYSGVHFNKASNEWMAQITIDQKLRYIGCYANEEEAAADYATAVFKYKGEEALAKERKLESAESRLLIDLNGVPPQQPIPKSAIYRLKEGGSKYAGVYLHRTSNTWYAQGKIEGKRNCLIGRYVNEEEAAIDYARAVFKYQGQEALDKARAIGQDISESAINIALSDAPPQLPIDLSDVPPVPPKLKIGKHFEKGTSKYIGIIFLKSSNKWTSTIIIDGKRHHIGYYENEEEAAIDYARAALKYSGRKGQLAMYKARDRNKSAPAIDLSDVPPQPPILKSADQMKEGSSKYFGVSYSKASKKWQAQISIDRICRHIGYYESEEEAAADYARAAFKYKGEKALDKARERGEHNSIIQQASEIAHSTNSNNNENGEGKLSAPLPSVAGDLLSKGNNNEDRGEKKRVLESEDSISGEEIKKRHKKADRFVLDLSDVPPQQPIPKRKGHIKEGTSKFTGVHFHKPGNKWCAQIVIEGKKHCIGYYENEEEAASDYARAVLKYKGQCALDKAREQNSSGSVPLVDLGDFLPQLPIPKSAGRKSEGTEKSSLSKGGDNENGGGKKRALPLPSEDMISGKEVKKRQRADSGSGSSAVPKDSSIISNAPINHTPHGHNEKKRTLPPPSDGKGIIRCAEAAAMAAALAAAKAWNPPHFGTRRPNKSAPADGSKLI